MIELENIFSAELFAQPSSVKAYKNIQNHTKKQQNTQLQSARPGRANPALSQPCILHVVVVRLPQTSTGRFFHYNYEGGYLSTALRGGG